VVDRSLEAYSSGFEEEFERARARRRDTEQPDIWLTFKKVDPSKLCASGRSASSRGRLRLACGWPRMLNLGEEIVAYCPPKLLDDLRDVLAAISPSSSPSRAAASC
jgi:hypothetical protein